MQTLGVVLCGGMSSRMGRDKGLILKDNVCWAEIAFRKLSQLSLPVVISVNSNQINSYKKIFSENILVEDSQHIGGPLNGILSAHNLFPGKDLVVLACDMVNMDMILLRKMYDVYVQKKNVYSCIVYKNNDYLEPLCGVYKSSVLHKISTDIDSGVLSKFSMKYILENGNTYCLDVPKADEDKFKNFNDPHTLN